MRGSLTEKELLKKILPNDYSNLRSTSLGLSGELGAGKTWLVRRIFERLNPGSERDVSSPTFNICNPYFLKGLNVNHFDLYRIQLAEELYDTGVFDSLGDSGVWTIIEWVNLFPEVEVQCDVLVEVRADAAGKSEYSIKKG